MKSLSTLAQHLVALGRSKRRGRRRLKESSRGSTAYSQEGEDFIIDSIFFFLNGRLRKDSGFYVDVGAHHPFTYSNTARLFDRGWSGINIDPSPEAIKLFDQFRPDDINLKYGVGEHSCCLTYFVYDVPAFNTFSEEAVAKNSATGVDWIRKESVAVESLGKLLMEHVPVGQKIDFLNVDVEGFDLTVLESNDWGRYRPNVIAIEQHGLSIVDVPASEVAVFLRRQGFVAWSKTTNTVFYVDADQAGALK